MPQESSSNLPEIYFVYGTVYGLKNLFNEPTMNGIALSVWDMLRLEKKMMLYAYAILPAHVYAIVQPLNLRLPDEIANDYEDRASELILNQLRFEKRGHIYNYLSGHRNPRNKFTVWQGGVFTTRLRTPEAITQKMDFIHNEPVEKMLAATRTEYRYSSAAFYDRGDKPLISFDDVRTLLG